MTNIYNFPFFYIFSTIKLPGVSKQIASNKSSKGGKDKGIEELKVTVKEENEDEKEGPENSKSKGENLPISSS